MLRKIINLSLSASLIVTSLNASVFSEIFTKSISNTDVKKVSMILEDKDFVNRKWDDLFKKISHSEETYSNLETAPQSALFGADKTSLRKNLDDELSEILFLITEDKAALGFMKDIRKLKQNIQDEKDNITKYKEQSMFQSDESKQAELQSKIEKSTKDIQIYQSNIEKVKESLIFNLSSAGVEFNSEQLDMLITRVDVDDILQLTLVYNNLKIVTEQLGKLMEVTKDDIKATKKYYAMFVILSEMIVYTQKQYLNKMDTIYLPKISKLVSESESIQQKTKMLLNTTKDENYKKALDYNLKNQILSSKTASLYKKQLIQQRSNIEKSLKKSTLDLQIALNTFKTVQISFTLLEIIKESRESFNALMNIQLPELIPFENKEMQIEYEKITKEISAK